LDENSGTQESKTIHSLIQRVMELEAQLKTNEDAMKQSEEKQETRCRPVEDLPEHHSLHFVDSFNPLDVEGVEINKERTKTTGT
jgi:hypothetical protein